MWADVYRQALKVTNLANRKRHKGQLDHIRGEAEYLISLIRKEKERLIREIEQ